MWRIIILTLPLLASVSSFTRSSQPLASAATEAQRRFAIENKYDDTGPGVKGPEYAYQTYKTLEDALIAYLDDPDTKLPEHEREKALNILQGQEQINYTPKTHFPNTVEEYNAYARQPVPPKLPISIPSQAVYQGPTADYGFSDVRGTELNDVPTRGYQKDRVNDAFSYQKMQAANGGPLSVAHYTKDGNEVHGEFDPNPNYKFSYGVHDKSTGDSKSAQETRADGVVRGFYSFLDADGQQRTVHYTADDKEGFKATVQRTHPTYHTQ